jgi:hypothetical protein
MLVEVVDHAGLEGVGGFSPLSIWIETADLKVPGSPCYEKLQQLLGQVPEPKVLDKPGSARNGRIHW